MLKFISFGSGSCGNCYYLFTDREGILIDVGIGVRALKKGFIDYGLKFVGGFGNILVTHDHADHIKSVGSISKKFGLPVYTTQLVHTGMDKNYCMRQKLSRDRRRLVESGNSYEIGGFKVSALHVPHDSSDNTGYFIEHDGVSFCLLTDVGHITDEMEAAIRQANYLVIEANYDPQMLEDGPYPQYLKDRIRSGNGHLSNVQCGEALARNYTTSLRHVWLCHLSEENNCPEKARDTVVRIMSDAGIAVGESVALDVLNRKRPTGIFELR